MIHLYSNQCHDESEVWCGEYAPPEAGSDPDKATCKACLLAAFEFGLRAMKQRLFVTDGTLLNIHQQIELLLDQIAHPVRKVR